MGIIWDLLTNVGIPAASNSPLSLLQLLCHQDQQIQRVALECVLTYKDPNIVPYK